MPDARNLALGVALCLSCAVASATERAVPPAPDYSQPDTWAAWPGHVSGADAIPPGITNTPAPSAPQVDVFFIHPTTYLSNSADNARFDEPGATSTMIDRGVLRFQASAFNTCCRIYAPHYRQAALSAFTRHDEARNEAALSLAYGDVLRAFDYFVSRENHGRPFIIAAHSQGSLHALRLLQERIASSPLQQQMVAAYVVGYRVPMDIERAGLPVCRQASRTGCIISWNTVKAGASEDSRRDNRLVWLEGRYQRLAGRPIVCVNPLNWTPDSDAPASMDMGALPAVRASADLEAPVQGLTGARCVNGDLTVKIPYFERHGFADALTLFGSYHLYDYNLFYANIRLNSLLRAAAFGSHR
jgi:hypothetical protein